MGETRGEDPSNPEKPTRFHAGVDIGDAPCAVLNATVEAIEDGVISVPPTPGCKASAPCRRVTSLDGKHAFEYVDIASSLSSGTIVHKGDKVGNITNGPGSEGLHLHLNEIIKVGSWYRINPQRLNALDFADSDTPTFYQVTIGSVTNDIVLVPKFQGTGYDGDQSYTPFNFQGNKFFVKGTVAAMVALNDDNAWGLRKGVYLTDLVPQFGAFGCGGSNLKPNIAFETLFDHETSTHDIRTLYFEDFTNSRGMFPNNLKVSRPGQDATTDAWYTDGKREGAYKVCVNAAGYPQGPIHYTFVNAVVDRTPPLVGFTDVNHSTFSFATSSTTVIVVSSDTLPEAGVFTISLSSPGAATQTSTNTSVTQSYAATFSGLTDGQYTSVATDFAGNRSQADFLVDTVQPTGGPVSGNGTPINGVAKSTTCITISGAAASGIGSISLTGPGGFSKTTSFSCTEPIHSTTSYSAQYCGLASGTYHWTVRSCSGLTREADQDIQSGLANSKLCLTGDGCSSTTSSSAGHSYTSMRATLPNFGGMPPTWYICDHLMHLRGATNCSNDGTKVVAVLDEPCVANIAATISNDTTSSMLVGTMQVDVGFDGSYSLHRSNGPPPANTTYSSDFTTDESSALCYLFSQGVASMRAYFGALHFAACSIPVLGQYIARITRRAWMANGGACPSGSDVAFSTGAVLNLTFSSAGGPAISTNTLAIYRWTGADWSSAAITNQQVSYDAGTGVVTASATIPTTGMYFALFAAPDSSAPVSSFSFQGTTTSFDGTVYVETSAYVVIAATDPVVDGWNSGLATTYYRLDEDAFAVYSSSFALPLGAHVLQYWSIDWNGNAEAIHYSTFVVTAGTVLKGSAGTTAMGKVLAGFLDYGQKVDVQSRAEDGYTLRISSQSGEATFRVSNSGNVLLEEDAFGAQLELGSLSGQAALLSRSGNSSSTSSVQVALGFDGGTAAGHAIWTEHDTGTAGNRLDFSLWLPQSGSTATLGNVDALSLQAITAASGGSVHVRPAGTADVELEVSDGASTGGGTIHRAAAGTHSSRALKFDISEFSEKDERKAAEDLASLKHARFRYKRRTRAGLVDDPSLPLHLGLVYEDSPESIRGSGQTLVVDDRLLNSELALKRAMRRLDQLEAEWQKIKEKRR